MAIEFEDRTKLPKTDDIKWDPDRQAFGVTVNPSEGGDRAAIHVCTRNLEKLQTADRAIPVIVGVVRLLTKDNPEVIDEVMRGLSQIMSDHIIGLVSGNTASSPSDSGEDGGGLLN